LSAGHRVRSCPRLAVVWSGPRRLGLRGRGSTNQFLCGRRRPPPKSQDALEWTGAAADRVLQKTRAARSRRPSPRPFGDDRQVEPVGWSIIVGAALSALSNAGRAGADRLPGNGAGIRRRPGRPCPAPAWRGRRRARGEGGAGAKTDHGGARGGLPGKASPISTGGYGRRRGQRAASRPDYGEDVAGCSGELPRAGGRRRRSAKILRQDLPAAFSMPGAQGRTWPTE